MSVKVIIDEKSGVCGGVGRAIVMIETTLESEDKSNIFVNGELLHNRLEMERLIDNGLNVEEDVSKIKNSHLFFRAHGVGKNIKELALKNGNKITDATCPKVLRSQRIIEDHYNRGFQIVIVGKYKHPEVKGLMGYCNDEGICIMDDVDLKRVDFEKKILLIAQTTVSSGLYNHFIEIFKSKVKDLEVANTICSFVENREQELIGFSQEYSVIIFIGGRNSSNTKVMFNEFKKYNKRSHLIENSGEIDFNWFQDGDVIGVSGSASTPTWQIEEIKNIIEQKFK